MSLRPGIRIKELSERLIRLVPLSGLLAVVAYYTARQVVSPHHRMVKVGVLGAVLLFMFRFDVIYSLFMFTLLFPFPSGISIGSTNSILMTLIGLVWAIRATSTGQPIHQRTRYDWAVILLLLSYVLSFYNVQTSLHLVRGVNVVWKQAASLMFFYLIIRFVNDEQRLMRFTKVVAIMVSAVVLTGLVELFMPGTTIIPGWIGLPEMKGKGSLTFRVEGIRLGGAVGGHNILSDIAMLGVFLMAFHALRSRNPLERVLWALALVGSIVVLFGTGNRGAVISLGVGVLYGLYWFRKRMSFAQVVMACMAIIFAVMSIQLVLNQYTYAVNVFDRLKHTRFEGIEPDTRDGIWEDTFNRSLEHPFVGHGPYYDPGTGLDRHYWPHNAYLYYLFTIGLIGLGAFLWIAWLLLRNSMVFREPAVWGTRLGDMAMLLHVELVMLLFSQIRTDHQRDEMHIHVIWMVFGLVATTGEIVRRRVREARRADSGAPSGPPRLT